MSLYDLKLVHVYFFYTVFFCFAIFILIKSTRALFFVIIRILVKSLSTILFFGQPGFYSIKYIHFFILSSIIYSHILISISLSLDSLTSIKFLFDPLYKEIVTNTSELTVYLARHFIVELALPLFIFVGVMLTLLLDWNWIPISSIERESGSSLEDVKKKLFS